MTPAAPLRPSGTSRPLAVTPEMVVAGRTLAEPRLSPDATCVVTHVRDGAGSRLIRIDLGDGPRVRVGIEVQVTFDPPIVGVHPSAGGSWTWLPDSSGIVYVCTAGLAIVARSGGVGRIVAAAPGGARFVSPTVSPDGSVVAVIVETDETQSVALVALSGLADPADHADVGGSQAAVFTVADGDSAVFRMDPDWGAEASGGVGKSLVWHEWRAPQMPWDNSTIVRVQIDGNGSENAPFLATWTRFSSDLDAEVHENRTAVPAMVGQPRFSPDGTRLGFVTDGSTGWANVCIDGRPVVADGAGEAFEHAMASWGPGQRSWCWSPDGASVAFVRNEGGFATLCMAGSGSGGGSVRQLGRAWHIGVSWGRTPTGADRIAAIRTGGVTPPQLVVYDLSGPTAEAGAAGKTPRTVVARGPVGGWEELGLPEPEVVHWLAADGAPLHGRLYPAMAPVDAGPASPSGVIVSCHGGPTDQNTVTFNPRFAYWMAQGWSVFVPDHRGSTGWGRDFQQAMNGRWGDVDVSDVADGVRWLIGTGRVDASRLVAMGGSAGGFCALHLLVRYPSLFACGVALYPVTDLAELDATTHRFERFYSATIVGPTTRYRSRSPITNAAALRRPLLLMHGDADPVVTIGQSRSYLVGTLPGGADVDLVVFEGEGHGWKKPETTVDELHRIDAFLYRHCPSVRQSSE